VLVEIFGLFDDTELCKYAMISLNDKSFVIDSVLFFTVEQTGNLDGERVELEVVTILHYDVYFSSILVGDAIEVDVYNWLDISIELKLLANHIV
jgi:hypothetical protein